MVYDPASPSSISGSTLPGVVLDDVPPSYESVASSSVGEASGSGASSGPGGAAAPVIDPALLSGPPNAEPLMSRERAAALPTIETRTLFDHVEVCDKRLETPDALYNFIRAQALQPPTVKIRAFASHFETSPRQQLIVEQGVPRQVQAGQRYRVTDFDFTIDLGPNFAHENNTGNISLFTLPTTIPARRGTLGRTFGASVAPNYPGAKVVGRTPSREEKKRWDAYAKFRRERGRAPWSDIATDDEFWAQYNRDGTPGVVLGGRESDEEALLSSQPGENDTALRAWCEAYIADPGLMKSFRLSKTVYGWDLASIRKAIITAILSTGYQATDDGGITVDFHFSADSEVLVRPDNFFSRYYFQPGFVHVIFMMLFFWVVPFIWLWQRVDTARASGPYEVANAVYCLKTYTPLPATFPAEQIYQARQRLPSLFKLHPELPKDPSLVVGPRGIYYLLGRREGEWFREWEERIRMAVRMKFSGELTDTRVNDDDEPYQELDGYGAGRS